MRPQSEVIRVSVINAGGNKIQKFNIQSIDGIFSRNFVIPDISEPGVWKIVAHYQRDEKNAVIREFTVQKFVLPSFAVTIQPERSYYLVDSEEFSLTVTALYSYGEHINGGLHCRFGMRLEEKEGSDQPSDPIKFIKGLEEVASINGIAQVTIKTSRLRDKLLNSTLEDWARVKAKLYIGVTVTDIKSGEVQEGEISVPIVLNPYSVDLSRTRSHYTPGAGLDVQVVVRLPNGLPAKGVHVQIEVSKSHKKSQSANTDDEGIVSLPFNLETTSSSISVEVTVEGNKYTKTVHPAQSPGGSFMYLTVPRDVLLPGQSLPISFNIISETSVIDMVYYMVFSKGEIKTWHAIKAEQVLKIHLDIRPEITPSFRVIAYYYDPSGNIIADSVWVDVQDVCEGTIKVTTEKKDSLPGEMATLNIDLGGQTAKVALLAVDKAIYALNTQNKLTPKQVFASMQSYDLGCSYGGGENTTAVFNDAGLAFISSSKTSQSQMRRGLNCESGFRRHSRSIDIQKMMVDKELTYEEAHLQTCCRHGFTLIPMKRTCEERAERVSRTEDSDCVKTFLDCCLHAENLRKLKNKEDLKKYSRSSAFEDLEDFFDNSIQHIRLSFPPSFEFKEITVDSKKEYKLATPDSITTWEIQAVSLSQSHGICVAEPVELRVFKPLFVSLRLPYSVKRYEQLSIVAVIYNYGNNKRDLAVAMKEVKGLCSPSAKSSYISVSVDAKSSVTVTFSAVPMITGEIPVLIQVLDTDFKDGVDAIQKMLLVVTEGVEKREEETYVINLNGRSETNFQLNGEIPNGTAPDHTTNLFVKIEGEVFGEATALPLLSPSKVGHLIKAPSGCAEQTMMRMSPTTMALRYLDKNNLWHQFPPGARDAALNFIEQGYIRILSYRKSTDGSYGAWIDHPSSHWLTALVVKVLSLVAERQEATLRQRGSPEKIVSEKDISVSVKYLMGQQNKDGSFTDPHPVIHRDMQGGIQGEEGGVSLTAFITIALNHSLPNMDEEVEDVKESISRATKYLLSRVDTLKNPYAVAITAYCLAVCLPESERTLAKPIWMQLKNLAMEEGECKVWRSNGRTHLPAQAFTVETTAYALLTALAHKDFEVADQAACYLITQENFAGGFKSSQDTIVALEALAENALSRPEPTPTKLAVQFSTPRHSRVENLALEKRGERVETELKTFVGHAINVKISGQGEAKMKVVKAYYMLEPEAKCNDVSISVNIEGKAEYTDEIHGNYDYDYDEEGDGEGEKRKKRDIPQSAIEWFDARSRRRRDTGQSSDSENTVMYHICVRYGLGRNATGMSIADITMLSGFEPVIDDLNKLKDLSDRYISHYEATYGRVILYFEKLQSPECVDFKAIQKVPIGLVQPAPATFYDYYEPGRRCTVFYSAPKRSNMVSTICTGDVCQCAEKPCFKLKKTLEMDVTTVHRLTFACYEHNVQYGYIVLVDDIAVQNNFELYSTTVQQVLKITQDKDVDIGDSRVFLKRRGCKDKLEKGMVYLIMGNDGSTTDSNGQMQYLLDSNTWVEEKPDKGKCKATTKQTYCKQFHTFLRDYQTTGCNM